MTGVSVDIESPLASEKAVFSAAKTSSRKHALYVDASLDTKFHGKLNTNGKQIIDTLP